MDVLPEIIARRSVLRYAPRAVDKEALERVLEAGRLAPSAKNRQEWRFIVAQRPDLRERIGVAAFGETSVGSAPVVIALCTTNVDYQMPNGQLSYPIDIAFAACHMVLQAVHEGLGSTIVTTFDEQQVQEILSVPYGMRVVMLVLVGHAEQMPEATPRKPFKRVVSYNHW